MEPMLYFGVNNSAPTLGAGRKAPPGIIISQSTLIEASLNFEVPNPQLKLSQSNSNQTQYLSLIVTDRQRLSLKPKQVLFFGKSFPGISRNLCRRVLLILKYKYRKENFKNKQYFCCIRHRFCFAKLLIEIAEIQKVGNPEHHLNVVRIAKPLVFLS